MRILGVLQVLLLMAAGIPAASAQGGPVPPPAPEAVAAIAGAPSVPPMVEPPFLAAAVAEGRLPPVAERIPARPAVVALEANGKRPGRYGGTLRILGGSPKDTRTLVVYGYARLVGYDENFNILPDIAESVDVVEGRSFTFHLRPGHRWSDGAPFTAEDFRYYWEDVGNDPEVSRFGPPKLLTQRRHRLN